MKMHSDKPEKLDTKNLRVALVTGSSSGIGANIAIDLSNAGFYVIVTGRNADSLEKIVNKCKPSHAKYILADLRIMEQVDSLVEFIRNEFAHLHLLVNNACWRGKVRGILDEQADFEDVMHINVTVPMYLIYKCLIPLRPDGQRVIAINMSSIAASVNVPLQLYSISKACLNELSKEISLFVDELGLISVSISPGPVLTDERPHHKQMHHHTLLQRVGETQEISDLVIFVANNAHLFNGCDLRIDGGACAKTPKQMTETVQLVTHSSQ